MIERALRVILFLLFFWGILDSVSAQDPSMQNLSTLNVDELTDDQITKFVQQAESGGYTEDQLLVLARARGMTEMQIQKLQQRIEKIRNGEGEKTTGATGIVRLRESAPLKREETKPTVLDPFSGIMPIDTLKPKDELEIFGLSFFQGDRSMFEPSTNVPTPQGYVIGPGDGIIIDIWGAFEYTYDLTVSPDGIIRITDLGPIQVSGLTMDQATKKIKERLKAIYSTLGQNAFADISLGRLRTINVNVVGEVKFPGTYSTSSFATPFNALYLAGGPNDKGSLRLIDIFRGGQKVATLDAYDYLIRGAGNSFTLQDEDVVLVRPYENRVSIYGEIKRPAKYEMTSDETIGALLEYAGGLTGEAFSDRISLRRNKGNFRAVSTVERGEFDAFPMKNGDIVEVKPISNFFTSRVSIQGAIFQPGEYELKEGLTLSQLVDLAGGVRGDAFLGRTVILRKNEDFSLSNLSVNLQELLAGSMPDVALENEDIIRIESIYDLREEYFVQILGEVLKPGKYPFVKGQTVEDLVYLAGGFKESAARSFVEVSRRNQSDKTTNLEQTAEIFNFPISPSLTLNEEASTFALTPFDLIVIRRSPFYEEQISVEITGEVLYPGMYALSKKDERISDVLRRAGGLTPFGYAKGATLVRRTEYYEGLKGVGAKKEEVDAAKVRMEELKTLLERDTLSENPQQLFKAQESIGINLEEIIKKPGSEFDLILKEGDVLNIPRELQTVRIRGEVLHPSNVQYSKSFVFRRFVSQAGGFTNEAKVAKAYVIYPNGLAQRTRSFLWFKDFPKVEPGAEIIVPARPERRRLSPGEVIGLTSGVATLSLVILRLVDYVGN